MNTNRSLAAAAIASLLGLSFAVPAAAADEKAKEKCFGIAKKAQNDCSTAEHSCSNEAKTDGDKTEWLWVPKGTCEKIVGGMLQAGK